MYRSDDKLILIIISAVVFAQVDAAYDGYSTLFNKNVDCRLPPNSGTCNSYYYPMYYYDPVEARCKAIAFSGCGGNANMFRSEVDCIRSCAGVVDYGYQLIPLRPTVNPSLNYNNYQRTINQVPSYGPTVINRQVLPMPQQQAQPAYTITPNNNYPGRVSYSAPLLGAWPTNNPNTASNCKKPESDGCYDLDHQIVILRIYYDETAGKCVQAYYCKNDGNHGGFDSATVCNFVCGGKFDASRLSTSDEANSNIWQPPKEPVTQNWFVSTTSWPANSLVQVKGPDSVAPPLSQSIASPRSSINALNGYTKVNFRCAGENLAVFMSIKSPSQCATFCELRFSDCAFFTYFTSQQLCALKYNCSVDPVAPLVMPGEETWRRTVQSPAEAVENAVPFVDLSNLHPSSSSVDLNALRLQAPFIDLSNLRMQPPASQIADTASRDSPSVSVVDLTRPASVPSYLPPKYLEIMQQQTLQIPTIRPQEVTTIAPRTTTPDAEYIWWLNQLKNRQQSYVPPRQPQIRPTSQPPPSRNAINGENDQFIYDASRKYKSLQYYCGGNVIKQEDGVTSVNGCAQLCDNYKPDFRYQPKCYAFTFYSARSSCDLQVNCYNRDPNVQGGETWIIR